MSGSPLIANSIETICSTYRDGHDLIQRIKAKRKARKLLRKDCPQNDEPIDELERSLSKGESTVQSQFNQDFRRFGELFANGDQAGRDALRDINVHLQQQINSKLKLHWQQDAHIEFAALQDASDSAQDRCILILLQLQQRIVTSGAVENVTQPSLSITDNYNERPLPAEPAPDSISEQGNWGFDFARPRPLTPSRSPLATKTPFGLEWSPQSTFAPPITAQLNKLSPPNTSSGTKSVPLVSAASQQTIASQNPFFRQHSPSQASTYKPPSPPAGTSHHRDGSKGSNDSSNHSILVDGSQNQYKPLATTTEKVGFFGIRKTKVEIIPDMPENPLVDKYLNEAIEEETKSLCRGYVSTARSTLSQDPEETSIYPYNEPDDDITSILTTTSTIDHPKPMEQMSSSDKLPTRKSRRSNLSKSQIEVLSSSRPLASIYSQDLLPNELNGYAGFCKGAWRQQIGDRKKAMEERVRPGSMYNTMKFWQCKQCKYEGRYVTPKSEKDSGYDMRIARLTKGIQFRWEFLFKSHIAASAPVPDPAKGTYGCIFCCAEGRGSPVFEGVVNFVKHLIEHRDRLPTGEVLYRMNCLVGREASEEEDFDINIVSREWGSSDLSVM